MAKRPDYEAIRKHADEKQRKLFEHLDRHRSVYADINREFYPLGVSGWTKQDEHVADSALYDEEHRMLTAMPMICLSKGSAGFNANLTPPASPWFRLKNSAASVDTATHTQKKALDTVTEQAREVMSRSNTYKSLAKLYDHILVNGFGCMLVTSDPKYIVNVRTLRPGTYALDIDGDGIVNRCVRRFSWTAEQIIDTFGDKGVPERIRTAYGKVDRHFTVYNLIEPHGKSSYDKIAKTTGLSTEMAYRSIYWLKDATATDPQSGIIEISGFKAKPIIAPRFDYELGDIYGTSPCAKALALARGAQTFRFDTLSISGLRGNPPLVVAAEFKDEGFDAGRGGINYSSYGEQNKAMAMPVFAQMPDADDARQSLAEVIDEMKTLLFVTAFQTIDSLKTNKGVKTATEVDALVRENMEGLGPVVMNLDRELLDPLVTAVVQCLIDSGRVQFGPGEEDAFSNSEIEYVSQIHVAARQSTIATLRDNADLILNLSKVYPQARHRLDVDKMIDKYADLTGCPEGVFADEEAVKMNRAADAEAAQQQQQAANAEQMAKAAAAAGGIPTDEKHAGSKLMAALSGMA